MAEVSILMNCYNGQKYLRQAIDSVYSQSFKDWEIIFIDNCSTDDTKKIINTYDKKIKYYKTEKAIPLGAARNFGLQFCKSRYLAFLDTDDLWLEHKLQVQVDIMQKHQGFKFSYSGVIFINDFGRDIKKNLPKAQSGDVFVQQLKQYEIHILSSLIRNNGDIKFSKKLSFSPDFELFMNLARKHKALVIKDYLVKYRKSQSSLTHKSINRWWIEQKQTLDKIFLENEVLKKKYPLEYKLAYAKVAYYKACYLVSIEKKKEATKILSKYKFINWKYFTLYLISLFPKAIWNFAHRFKS